MIITVTMNPAMDKTLEITDLNIGGMNRVIASYVDAGGKGINVSKTIKALGGTSLATGIICGATGTELLKLLREQGILTDFFEGFGNTRTNLKIADLNGIVTEINEKGPKISREEQLGFLDKIINYMNENTLVVLSGSVPQGIDCYFYEKLIHLMQAKKAKVFLDADGELFHYGILASPYMIKPNYQELMEYFHWTKLPKMEQIIEACKTFINDGIKMVVVSLGKEGAIFIKKDSVYIGRGLEVVACSTVGAGDAMLGALVYGMEKNLPYIEVLRLMMATSAGAVMTRGTKPSEWEVIKTLMNDVIIEQYYQEF